MIRLAKINLLVEDREDGTIGATAEFDPPLPRDDVPSPAQGVGVALMSILMSMPLMGGYVEDSKGERYTVGEGSEVLN